MRDERPRRGTARDGLHHGRLDLEVPAIFHIAPDPRDDARTRLKGADRPGVGVHVHVAAAVPQLGVGQPVVLLRRGLQRLAVHLEAVGPDADLLLLGHPHRALGHDDVAVVELLCDAERSRIEIGFRDRDLQVTGLIAQRQEDQLAHRPVLHAPAGHASSGTAIGHGLVARLARRDVLLVRGPVEAGAGLGERHQVVNPAAVRVDAELVPPPRELLASRPLEFVHPTLVG